MYKEMEEELRGFDLKASERSHRRGEFPALAVGVSYGNGQTVPARLAAGDTGPHSEGLHRLIGSPVVQRVAAYGDSALQLWAPRLYSHYRQHVEEMHRALPRLRRNFRKSVFSCTTFNFGPNVRTFAHRDTLNLAYGWCSITALGRFDHTKGGHLVLWDAKLIIEFPANSTILIPSSTVLHSNIAVQKGEERASFTQYCAGGLFRWVDNGCRTQADFQRSDFAGYSKSIEDRAHGWEQGLRLLSTLDELESYL